MDNSLKSELDNSIRCFYDILSKLKDVDKYLEDNGICVQCRNPLYDKNWEDASYGTDYCAPAVIGLSAGFSPSR